MARPAGYRRLAPAGNHASSSSTRTIVLFELENLRRDHPQDMSDSQDERLLQSAASCLNSADELPDTHTSRSDSVRGVHGVAAAGGIVAIRTPPPPQLPSRREARHDEDYECEQVEAKGRWRFATVCISILFAGIMQIAVTTLNVNARDWSMYREMPGLLSALYPIVALTQIISMLSALRYLASDENMSVQKCLSWTKLLTPLVQALLGGILFSGVATLHYYHHARSSIHITEFLELTAACTITSCAVTSNLDTALYGVVLLWKRLPPTFPGMEFFILPVVSSIATLATCQLLPAVGLLLHDHLHEGVTSCVVVAMLLLLPIFSWMLYRRVQPAERQGWLGSVLPLLAWCCLGIAIDSNLWMYTGELTRLMTVINGVVMNLLMIHYHVALQHRHTMEHFQCPSDTAACHRRALTCIYCCCRQYAGRGVEVTVAWIGLAMFPVFLFVLLLALRGVAGSTITPFSFNYISTIVSHGCLVSKQYYKLAPAL
eukprot:scpid74376/ scgid4731/ 